MFPHQKDQKESEAATHRSGEHLQQNTKSLFGIVWSVVFIICGRPICDHASFLRFSSWTTQMSHMHQDLCFSKCQENSERGLQRPRIQCTVAMNLCMAVLHVGSEKQKPNQWEKNIHPDYFIFCALRLCSYQRCCHEHNSGPPPTIGELAFLFVNKTFPFSNEIKGDQLPANWRCPQRHKKGGTRNSGTRRSAVKCGWTQIRT